MSVPGALSTGIINVSASSDVDGLAGLRMATATASVNTLSVGLAGILSLSATSVGSTATETGEPLSSLGSTTIVNGVLTIGLTNIPIPANPAPNTSLFNAGGISVIVNEPILGVEAALTSNIPEPSTALLLGVGLVLVSIRRR